MIEPHQPTVLVVEDEELMRAILRQLLEKAGYTVVSADSAESALDAFSANDISVTLTDIRMSGRDGLELLDQIKDIDDEAVVIIMTAYSSVDTAIAALRKGAYDYVAKPFVNEDLLQTVKNAITHRQLFHENRLLRRELRQRHDLDDIIGKSEALESVFAVVRKVSESDASVLIQGESGTGKELIARAIHRNSPRADGPFLAINCGALPGSILESELFGHKRGAFTGAIADSQGLFRSAGGGTILLDEIGEMPAELQVKLLRALQEREVTPVGASMSERFDARILAATNRDLAKEVETGKFREDLYYRLNVIEITMPPLRERREDIPLLVRHFLARAKDGASKQVTDAAMTALVNYDWPGNVRELENAVERAVILGGNEIDVAALPAKIADRHKVETNDMEGYMPTLDEVERRYLLEIMASTNEDKARAAEILGIDLSTLYRKLKRYEES